MLTLLSFCSIGEEVYRFYFEDAGPAPKGQPQARNTTALLRASHQVHCEARSFLFKEATLTLHVSRDYPNQPLADMVTFLERGIKYEDLCLTPYASLSSFKKARLPNRKSLVNGQLTLVPRLLSSWSAQARSMLRITGSRCGLSFRVSLKSFSPIKTAP